VILVRISCPGGQSHIDTYDPKPDASSEYRGPFKTISTKVPGTHFTELMPMQAKIADKFTVLRSMNQTAGGHPAGTMQMLSGDPDTRDKPAPRLPDWMSVAHHLRSKDPQRPGKSACQTMSASIPSTRPTAARLSRRMLCAVLGDRGSEPPAL
jgi:hypothetical protein